MRSVVATFSCGETSATNGYLQYRPPGNIGRIVCGLFQSLAWWAQILRRKLRCPAQLDKILSRCFPVSPYFTANAFLSTGCMPPTIIAKEPNVMISQASQMGRSSPSYLLKNLRTNVSFESAASFLIFFCQSACINPVCDPLADRKSVV